MGWSPGHIGHSAHEANGRDAADKYDHDNNGLMPRITVLALSVLS